MKDKNKILIGLVAGSLVIAIIAFLVVEYFRLPFVQYRANKSIVDEKSSTAEQSMLSTRQKIDSIEPFQTQLKPLSTWLTNDKCTADENLINTNVFEHLLSKRVGTSFHCDLSMARYYYWNGKKTDLENIIQSNASKLGVNVMRDVYPSGEPFLNIKAITNIKPVLFINYGNVVGSQFGPDYEYQYEDRQSIVYTKIRKMAFHPNESQLIKDSGNKIVVEVILRDNYYNIYDTGTHDTRNL